MGKRAAKIRRLTAVGAPQDQLVEIVRRLRETPELADAVVTRHTIQNALDRLWKDVGTTLPLPLGPGKDWDWHIADLRRQLKYYLQNSTGLRQAFAMAWEKHPSTEETPWHLIVFDDEIVPGAVLKLDNRRKMQGVYLAFLELGPEFLCCQDVWVPVALLRSTVAKTILGGWSGCMKALLRRWFEGDRIQDGFVVPIGTTFARIFVKLGTILADGDAQRAVWSAKGSSGKLICLLCKNVLSDRVASDYLVHLSCCNPNSFDLASNADIWEKCDNLHRDAPPAQTKAYHEELQRAYGITYSPHALLWDVPLRRHVQPADHLSYDPMHCLLSNGVVENETSALLASLKGEGFLWHHLRSFAEASWSICKAYGGAAKMQATFGRPREVAFNNGGGFKAGASEMLVAFPIILHFLYRVVRPAGLLQHQIESYAALGKILELYRRGKRGIDVSAELRDAIQRHSQLHTIAYDDDWFRPKNHFLHHIPVELAKHHVILDCFVGERRHGYIKKAASDILNTRAFEKSVLVKVIDKQLDIIQHEDFLQDSLIRPQDCAELAATFGSDQAAIANSMTLRRQLVASGDAVWVGGILHMVQACALVDGQLGILADAYTFVAQVEMIFESMFSKFAPMMALNDGDGGRY